MTETTDCGGKTVPVFARAKVLDRRNNLTDCRERSSDFADGAVFTLKVSIPFNLSLNGYSFPRPGQFYMLRTEHSAKVLSRPISVFHVEKKSRSIIIEFLILKKGEGTRELYRLKRGDILLMLGPLGNMFPAPDFKTEGQNKVCLIGGGIGVAPVAGFAESLVPKSYDFIASFKSASYGLEHLKADDLIITTEDGSEGLSGMLPAAVDSQKLIAKKYTTVYACGPLPMLEYVKKICGEARVRCWLSMEARMACGMGVCLGCSIKTKKGYKKCCVDGPVFDGEMLIFESSAFKPRRKPLSKDPDLSVNIAGVRFINPVIAASGTFGFGTEYMSVFDVKSLGGIASKGLTLEERQGNSGIRIWETPSGIMNSVGLQNPGIKHFIEHELGQMLKLGPVTLANLSGSTLETYVEGAKLLDKTDVPMIELNISCPNVSQGGAAWGMSCSSAAEATRAVRAVTAKPLAVKLTPQAPDLIGVAVACINEGADALVIGNSFQGVAIDIENGRPVFDKVKAGVGGPAMRPLAVKNVYEIASEINKLPPQNRVPLIGVGGIVSWQDAVEFIMAGASAVEIGSGTFIDPYTMLRVIDGLSAFMKRKGYASIEEMRGCAL
ncbi:dihydroorotate dehydrogenase [Treponema parvum]|uniref:Dihydroorotate dehydrogenase n=1 Tax=Treponema parvum TaxID=138851 RepID=A0A975F5I0_9SPIR|nr:dihydroorotate dehydrogenase [Treponema parvum]QTQ14871.1 dihydroorotate dehydrogenase [Treponema parvum]